MANLKLLQEAIEAFANGEQDVADKKCVSTLLSKLKKSIKN
ncbi:UNVERIFIED_ORG: hypothetical protein [Escherichia phage CMSTMSU]